MLVDKFVLLSNSNFSFFFSYRKLCYLFYSFEMEFVLFIYVFIL